MTVTVAALVMTDGRVDCLDRTLASFDQHVPRPIDYRYLWDDTGNDDHFNYLRLAYRHRGWVPVRGMVGKEGFGGAIRSAWQWLLDNTDADYIFHVEDDFLFEQPVPVDAIIKVLERRPYLAQMALRRQAVNADEIAAGGVVELNPDKFTEVRDGRQVWIEHRQFHTTNPSLFRRALLEVGWPEGDHSEGVFTHRLLGGGFDDVSGDAVRFGYWGAKTSAPWIHHIGDQRVGHGY